MSQVVIYTDGSCYPNPGPGGWGAVLIHEKGTLEIYGGAENQTNNTMELTAAIEALKVLKWSCDVSLYTDSQYLKMGITEWLPKWISRGWRTSSGKGVKNVELWQALHHEAARHIIKWHWVKGHADNEMNERADQLASQGRKELKCD